MSTTPTKPKNAVNYKLTIASEPSLKKDKNGNRYASVRAEVIIKGEKKTITAMAFEIKSKDGNVNSKALDALSKKSPGDVTQTFGVVKSVPPKEEGGKSGAYLHVLQVDVQPKKAKDKPVDAPSK
jgi:hypothetical protein